MAGLIMLGLVGCATPQPQPGPWVLKDGAWCQTNTPDCRTPVKYPQEKFLGISADTWDAMNNVLINAHGVTLPKK
jgi:hypothetical protein